VVGNTAASPPAWLLCSVSSQTCTCGVNPMVFLRDDRFVNHNQRPCQSTAQLGDGGLLCTPAVPLVSGLLHQELSWPSPSSLMRPALFWGLVWLFNDLLSFSSTRMCAQHRHKAKVSGHAGGAWDLGKEGVSGARGRSPVSDVVRSVLQMPEAEGA